MELSSKSSALINLKTHCLILPILAKGELPELSKTVDKALDGLISDLIKSGDASGDQGSQLLLPLGGGVINAQRLLLVGCGEADQLDAEALAELTASACKTLEKTATTEAVTCLSHASPALQESAVVLQCAIQAKLTQYRFEQYKSQSKAPKNPLKQLTWYANNRSEQNAINTALAQASAIAEGMSLTRDLGNMPPNDCHPSYLADQAKALAKSYTSVKTTVLNQAQMQKAGMGALLAVAKGSEQPPALISMEYKGLGKRGSKPIVLVGKGVTFDTGGISIKPAAGMDEMKYDMCGAATVFGVIKACAEMKLPLDVVGIVPAVENMPDGRATRPGDIVKASDGTSIEILNTDAEGRLILCDALVYAAKYKPEYVIDIATLTGACIVALGHHTSGLMANDDELAQRLSAAGERIGDSCWRLPLGPKYTKQLNSPFADLANIGGRTAGTITAGAFLAHFTKDYRWAHLDIAGTAWSSGSDKGASARPVPLLMQFLLDQA